MILSVIFTLFMFMGSFSNNPVKAVEKRNSINFKNFSNASGKLKFSNNLSGKKAASPASSIALDFVPDDSVMDPTQPIIYFTDKADKKVYSVNYETQEIKSLQLDLPCEKIAYYNNEIYVTLLKGNHDINVFPGSGAIGIIDAETLSKDTMVTFNIDIDPYDIAVGKDGNIYVTPGSGQSSHMECYSRQTKCEISSLSNVYSSTTLQTSPTMDKVYYIDNYNSPAALNAVNTNQGQFEDSYGAPQMPSDCLVKDNFRLSPDGKYLFNSWGSVFNTTNNKTTDMTYANKLNKPFSDIAFNIQDGVFYTAVSGNSIYVYNYNNLSPITSVDTDGDIQNLYYNNSKLIGVSKDSNGKYSVETYDENTIAPLAPVYTYPEDNAQNFEISGPLFIQFNLSISVDSNINNNIVLSDSSKNIAVNGKIFSQDGTVLEIDHNDLAYNTQYTLTVNQGAVKDTTGEKSNDKIAISFKTGQEITRLGGQNRYDTNLMICKQGWSHCKYVVIATGNDYPDALCAAPLATAAGCPIILSEKNALSNDAIAEIKSLGVQDAYIIGGTGVLSGNIENQLKTIGVTGTRLNGKDRYETSVLIAGIIKDVIGVNKVVVVSGSGYADSLSISSYASRKHIPILLTGKDSIPAVVSKFITDNKVQGSIVVGGTAVVSDAVYKALPGTETTDGNIIEQSADSKARIAGRNRYETNYLTLATLHHDFTFTFFSYGKNFPDALTGSVLAALLGGPILLVSDDMPQNVIEADNSNKSIMKMKVVLGGTGVVSDSIINRIIK